MTITKQVVGRWIGNVLMVLLALFMLTPVVYMLMMSFRTGEEIAEKPLGVPSRLYLDNYVNALGSMDYVSAVINSVGITLSVTVLVALIGSLAAET